MLRGRVNHLFTWCRQLISVAVAVAITAHLRLFVYSWSRAFIYSVAQGHQGIIFLHVSSSHNFVALFAGDSFTFVGIYVSSYEEAQFMYAHLKYYCFYTFLTCLHVLKNNLLFFSVPHVRLSTAEYSDAL